MKQKLLVAAGVFTLVGGFLLLGQSTGANNGVVSQVSADTPNHIQMPTSGNLIANPGAEQLQSGLPQGWNKGVWGSNKSNFTVTSQGHNSGHALSVSLSKYKNGDAKWFPVPVKVQPNTVYTFSDWYQSNVPTSIDVVEIGANGQTSYVWLGDVPASSSWNYASFSFKTPASTKMVTFYHSLNSNGKLTVDDFNFVEGADSTPSPSPMPIPLPTTNPTNPGSTSGNTYTGPVACGRGCTTGSSNTGSTDPGTVQTPTPTPTPVTPPVTTPTAPTVSFTSPTNSQTIKGTVSVSASVTDAQGIKSVQYKLDGTNLGSALTALPYSTSLDTTKVANGSHSLSVTVTNTVNLTTTASETINVQNPTAPTVQVTSPTANTDVSGSINLTASASDAQGVASVQFLVDGVNYGSPVTASPYTVSLDTTTLTNGSHSVSAVATNTANLSTTATAVGVNVLNQTNTPTPPSTNMVPNPSFEDSTNNLPNNWAADSWGTNTASLTYLNTGHTGNHSAQVTISNYTNGSADWAFDSQPVTAGTAYIYSDWYESAQQTEIDAAVTMSDNTVQYFYVTNVMPSATWAQAKGVFTAPAGAVSVSFFHLLAANGTLTIDDASLAPYTATPFDKARVSVTLDDGWQNQFTNGRSALVANQIPATFYIISGELTDQPDYMSVSQIQTLINDGDELGSHTITHPDLTTLTTAKMQKEMQQSQATLESTFGIPVTDFAYPYGAYNAATVAFGDTLYQSQRSVEEGYNTKDNINMSDLKVQDVYNTTTPAQVQAWVDQAIAEKAWLILVYHEIAVTPADPTDVQYTTQPGDFAAEMQYIHNSGVAAETVKQAISELLPQL